MIDTRSKETLPAINEDVPTERDEEFTPTSEGQIRMFFDGRLMAWNQIEFQVAFDSEGVLDPNWLVVDPPVENYEYDPEGDVMAALMPGEEIAVREKSTDAEPVRVFDNDGNELEISRERVWRPENGQAYDFEIRLEVTPYEEVSDGE